MRLRPLLKNDSRVVKDQRGAASIYVSFIIMIILSLLALTFAQIMSDRYLEIADSQFDLQAHYAAESAINSVRAAIHKSLRDREQVSNAAVDVTVEQPIGRGVSAPLSCGSGSYGAALDVEGDVLAVGAPTAGAFGDVCLLTKRSDALDWSSPDKSESVSGLLTVHQPPGSSFGDAVALSQNGSLLAVGAPTDRGGRGSVYIFRNQNGSWEFQTKIIPGSSSGDFSEMALLNAEELNELTSIIPDTTLRFGTALEWHEGVLLVGAPSVGNPSAGSVYGLNNNTWTLEASITPALSDFGLIITSGSVRFFEKDGQNASLAVGAKAQEMIYLYEDWKNSSSSERFCKYTTDTSSDTCFGKNSNRTNSTVTDFDFSGGILAVGYSDDNSVDILEREGPDWKKKYRIIKNSRAPPLSWKKIGVTGSSSRMGQAVSLVQMQDNDRLLIIGDPGEGKIHFFTVESNDILNDIWASGIDQDCPDPEKAHEAWRNSQLSAGVENIHYTCVSVEVDPESLIYENVGTDRSLVLPIYPVDGDTYKAEDLESLTFEWSHIDGLDNFRDPAGGFPEAATWADAVPVLRIQITPVNLDPDPSTTFNRADLNDATRVFFFYPASPPSGTGLVAWPTRAGDGLITDGICATNSDFSCKVKITGIPKTPMGSPPGSTVYFTRIQSIYNPAQLRITGELHGTTPPLEGAHFKNIQAVITATGWSGNVAQRIRERIPLRPIYDLPEYGIDSAEDLCKILVTTEHTGVYLDSDREDAIRNDPSCSLKTEDQ